MKFTCERTAQGLRLKLGPHEGTYPAGGTRFMRRSMDLAPKLGKVVVQNKEVQSTSTVNRRSIGFVVADDGNGAGNRSGIAVLVTIRLREELSERSLAAFTVRSGHGPVVQPNRAVRDSEPDAKSSGLRAACIVHTNRKDAEWLHADSPGFQASIAHIDSTCRLPFSSTQPA